MKRYYLIWLYAVVLAAFATATVQGWLEERRLIRVSQERLNSIVLSVEQSVLDEFRRGGVTPTRSYVEQLQKLLHLDLFLVCAYDAADNLMAEQSFPGCGDEKQENTILASHFVNSVAGLKLQVSVGLSAKKLSSLWYHNLLSAFLINLALGLTILLFVAAQVRQWIQDQFRAFRQTLRTASPTPTMNEYIRHNQLVVLANREPYIHERDESGLKVIRPASGLVSALEPILRQSGGIWIAHGSGSADKETAGPGGELLVPPDKPRYALRRIWLTEEEELGYYYGFSNEGLWALCHLAHTRPIFRLSDWQHYKKINARFAEAIPSTALTSKSAILVQDYHFALVPELIKKRRLSEDARVGLFWHIPWPNPEAFGICPWGNELLRGMLGADVIGFHTQYHCNNFLETCNRYLEARIDWEHFSVTMDNHETFVRAFPIGIDTPPVRVLSDEDREKLKEKLGIRVPLVAIGVDRVDYTKGLVERVEAVERFLEKYPEYIGRFSLAQIGSPSRTHIPAYQQLSEQLKATIARVNSRFGDGEGYLPVVYLLQHHEWNEIQDLYQIGNVCLVTSLHDGMNLVAKEYVWCQQPDQGALVLSKFTGASRELTEAFIVNPYSTEEMADAIHSALILPREDRIRRMLAMREKVQKKNAYQWGSDLIKALVTSQDANARASTGFGIASRSLPERTKEKLKP